MVRRIWYNKEETGWSIRFAKAQPWWIDDQQHVYQILPIGWFLDRHLCVHWRECDTESEICAGSGHGESWTINVWWRTRWKCFWKLTLVTKLAKFSCSSGADSAVVNYDNTATEEWRLVSMVRSDAQSHVFVAFVDPVNMQYHSNSFAQCETCRITLPAVSISLYRWWMTVHVFVVLEESGTEILT